MRLTGSGVADRHFALVGLAPLTGLGFALALPKHARVVGGAGVAIIAGPVPGHKPALIAVDNNSLLQDSMTASQQRHTFGTDKA